MKQKKQETTNPRRHARVLHMMAVLERSGMEMMLLTSYDEWKSLGYECDIVSTAPEIGPMRDALRASGYNVFHFPFRSLSFRLLPRLGFIREFFWLCRNYEVLHIHTEGAAVLFVCLARLAGIRRICLTLHNTFLFDGFLRIRKMIERALVRLMGGRYGMISDGVASTEELRFKNHGVRIHNWIDEHHFCAPTDFQRSTARSRLGCADSTLVIVTVGNCNAFKNHENFLRAVAQLAKDTNLLYLHLGRENESQPERVLAKQLGLGEMVHFIGSENDVRKYLWAADVFAMPSTREGLGMAAVEAAAAGVSCLFTRIPALVEIASMLKHTVITDTNANSLADGLRELAARPQELRRAQGKTDSEIMRSAFSMQAGVRSITLGLYTIENPS